MDEGTAILLLLRLLAIASARRNAVRICPLKIVRQVFPQPIEIK